MGVPFVYLDQPRDFKGSGQFRLMAQEIR
jgi:hypothetical protein